VTDRPVNILVCGGSGQVGIELQRQPWAPGVRLHAPARNELDLTDEASIARLIRAGPWACVINAAAFTAVDKAESEVASAWKLNALGPAILASETAKAGIPLLHISTDYVFDGLSKEPYQPQDAVRPLSIYGASKEGGEQAVRAANAHHVIVRTAWVVSPHRTNFVKTMLRLAQERNVLRVVDDQTGCPTSATDLAAALRTVALRQAAGSGPYGTYHFVNEGKTTWCQFARAIMAGVQRRGGQNIPVEAIATADYKTAAHRPANSALSTETLTRDYGIRPRKWQDALDEILDALVGKA
jgi:dTDP-4-dehydrorhamnose reductase